MLLPLFWAMRKATGDARVEGDVETLVSVVHICHQATSLGAIRYDLTHCCRVLCWCKLSYVKLRLEVILTKLLPLSPQRHGGHMRMGII